MFKFLGHYLSFVETSSVRRIYSPFEGNILPTKYLKNPILSNNIIGPSIAVLPTSNEIISPCEGEIKEISDKKNALIIKTGKVELILNIGINSKSYPDYLYVVKVKKGDFVGRGKPLIAFDLEVLRDIDPSFACVITIRQIKTIRSYAFTSERHVSFDSVLFKVNIS